LNCWKYGADSRIFGNSLKSILSMIPKHDLILICCAPTKKFYKNNGGQEVTVSKVEKQLTLPDFPDLENFQELLNI
jgi:hypothetical protein